MGFEQAAPPVARSSVGIMNITKSLTSKVQVGWKPLSTDEEKDETSHQVSEPTIKAESLMERLRYQYNHPSPAVIHLIFVTAAWIYSGMHVLSKPAVGYLPAFVFAVIRQLLALPTLFLLTLTEERVDITWSDNFQLMAIGFGGIGIAQSVIFLANKLVGAGIIAMMIPLATIFTALLSGILGIEPISWLKGCGILVAIAGSVGIALVTESDFKSSSMWGVAVMFLQALGWSSYLIMLSKFLKRKPIPLYAYFRASLWGLAFMLPFAVVQLPSVDWAQIPYWVWLVEAYCAVLVSSGAHAMMSWLVHHCAALLPALYTCLQPLITVFLATLFLGEVFNVWLIMCMFTILGGLIIVIIAKAKESKMEIKEQTLKITESADHAKEDQALLRETQLSAVMTDSGETQPRRPEEVQFSQGVQ